MKKMLAVSWCAFALGAMAANTWYVDNTLGRLEGGVEVYDGKSATVADGHGPFFKIMSAVGEADAGDTVKVAAGVYGDEQGCVAANSSHVAVRVYIEKSITLEGAGREKTILQGALDADKGVAKGWSGANSVSGISIKSTASETKIKSLTICNCSQSLTTGSGTGIKGAAVGFGGTETKTMANKPWVVDCVVSNIFHSGAPVNNVNVARTLIANTYAVVHTDMSKRITSAIGALGCGCAIHSVFFQCSDVPREACADANSLTNYLNGDATPISVQNCDKIVNCVWIRNMNAATPGNTSNSNVSNIFNCVTAESGYNNRAIRAVTMKDCILYGDNGTATTKENVVNFADGLLAAPLLCDVRPVVAKSSAHSLGPTTSAVGFAAAANTADFPEEYRWTDFYGNAFEADANGKICAGAAQVPIVPAAAFKAQNVVIDGHSTCCLHRGGLGGTGSSTDGWIYVATNEWPRVFELDWDRERNSSQREVFNYEVDDGSMVKMPAANGKALFVPRRGIRNGSVTATFPNKTVYVSKDGDNGNAGTEDAPVATIQAGVDKTGTTYGYRYLVKVGPGDYATGGYDNNNAGYRVLIGSTRKRAMIGIRSTDGAARTRILGNPASEDVRDQYGFGTNACRCVGTFGSCTNGFIQGFTLANGTCASTNDTSSAGVFAESKNFASYPFFTVADCIITNCTGASEGGVAKGVRLVRCKIVENRTYVHYLLRFTHVVNSLVDGVYDIEPNMESKNNVLCTSAFQGSTLIGRDPYSMPIPSAFDYIFDTVLCVRAFGGSGKMLYGSVMGEFDICKPCRDANPFPVDVCYRKETSPDFFVDYDGRDYHLVNTAKAIGAGAWAALPGYDVAPVVTSKSLEVAESEARTRYYDNITYDLDGNMPTFVKGKAVAGCYQRPSAVRPVITAASAVTVGGLGANGTLALGETTRLHVDFGSRPPSAVTLNGEEVDAAGFDVTLPPYDPNTTDWKALQLDIAVAPCTWYVDDANGDDTADGWTEETAFRTLKAAFARAESGDTVVALPGTYSFEDGTTVSPGGTLPAVAVVPEGVKLVSRDGAAATVIEGKVSETFWVGPTQDEARGDGPGNVRCVFLQPNSLLDGFTVRHGGPYRDAAKQADKVGGGVYANVTSYAVGSTPKPQATVRNCRIELCSGGLYQGVYEHCTIVSNVNPYATNALYDPQLLYGCIIVKNRGASCVASGREIVGCTLSDNLYLNGRDIGECYANDPQVAEQYYVNCIFHESARSSVSNPVKYAYNCIIPREREKYFYSVNTKAKNPSFNDPEYKNLVVEKVELDENYRPVNLSSKAVDVLTNASEYAAYPKFSPSCDVTKDLTGGQRVYNGAQDLGAVEADWRGVYAANICTRRLTVAEASPETVRNADEKVEIRSGELKLVWKGASSGDAQATMSFEVKGDGTLTLTRGGEISSYTKADGAVTLPFTLAKNAEDEILFSYVPAQGDTEGAEIGPFTSRTGLLLILK